MSEYSGKRSRGRMVGLVFAMQGAGLIVGPLVASILLASGIGDDIIWRILLGLGAIPGLAVFYLRRQIHETPRFAIAGGVAEEAERAATADAATDRYHGVHRADRRAGGPEAAVLGERVRRDGPAPADDAVADRDGQLLGLLDFAYYGNTISSPEVLALINPPAGPSSTTPCSSWPSSPSSRSPGTPWPSSCWIGPAGRRSRPWGSA